MHLALQNVPIFSGLKEEAYYLLAEHALEARVLAGELIINEGEMGDRFYLISTGMVRVCKHFGEPEEVELAVLGDGDFFGEMCILETLPRAATVQALTDCVIFSVTTRAFAQLYQNQPQEYAALVLNIARDLSQRIRRLDEIFAARH